MNWSDPDSNPTQDIRDALEWAKEPQPNWTYLQALLDGMGPTAFWALYDPEAHSK